MPNGQRSILNAPGLSQSDITSGIAQALSFIPAGRLAALGKTLAQRVGIGAAGAGATEAGLQAVSKALGSEQEIDKGQVVLAAALGPLAEVGTAATTGGKRLLDASRQEIPEQVARALEQGRVFTSDLFPPESFIGANLQRLAEKIPVVGTGSLRSIQQREREQAVRDLAGSFDVDIQTPFEEEIVSSATRVFDNARKRASELRVESVDQLVTGGEVGMTKASEVVGSEIAKQETLGQVSDQGLLNSLKSIQAELKGDFNRVGAVRTTVNNMITDIGRNRGPIASGGDVALNNVRRAITDDMTDFAKDFSKSARESGNKEGGKAFSKWKASNRIFAEGFEKARDAKLKQVLTKGQATPEVVNATIRGGRLSDLNRLNANLDDAGKQAARQSIIRDAIEKSGGIDDINPTKFINELKRPNVRKATNVFFKGKDKRELEGFKEFLDITRRAQQVGVLTPTGQELLAPTAVVAAGLAPKLALPILAPIAGGARIFESESVRNLMIKLGSTTTKEGKEKIIRKLQPLILEESRRNTEER